MRETPGAAELGPAWAALTELPLVEPGGSGSGRCRPAPPGPGGAGCAGTQAVQVLSRGPGSDSESAAQPTRAPAPRSRPARLTGKEAPSQALQVQVPVDMPG